jgi:ankyrin repeat protein
MIRYERKNEMKKQLLLLLICMAFIGLTLFIRRYALANSNNADVVIVEDCFDPDAPGNQLIDAVRIGDMERVVTLLQNGADPNWVWEDSGPPLVTAILAGTIEMLVPLLEYGADVRVTDYTGKTAYDHSLDWYPNDPMLKKFLMPKQAPIFHAAKGRSITPAA